MRLDFPLYSLRITRGQHRFAEGVVLERGWQTVEKEKSTMDIANVGVNFAMLRGHLLLFAILLFALPTVSFLTFEFWTAARASKTQRTTSWIVPADLESEEYRFEHRSVAFARRPRRAPVRRPRSRGRA